MMTLRSDREQEKVMSAVEDASLPGGRPYKARIGFYLDGQDYTEDLRVAEWSQVAVPITLDAEIAGYVPISSQMGKTLLVVQIDDVPIPQLHGERTACRPGENAYTTNILSSTAGAYLASPDAITLNSYTEYPFKRPGEVVWDVARRLPYDPSMIEIEDVPGVVLNYSRSGQDPGFLAEEKTGDVLSRLLGNAAIGYDFRDTAQRGFVAERPKPPGRSTGGAVKTYHASQLPDWNMARPETPEAVYANVRVFCTNEAGRLLWEIWEDVPYSGSVTPPHEDQTFHVAFNDTSPGGYQNGRALASRTALHLSRLSSVGEMLLPAYDPLYERGDPYRVEESIKTREGHTDLLWGMVTTAYKHGFGAQLGTGQQSSTGNLATLVGYSGTILAQNTVKPPSLIVPGYTGGYISPSPIRPWGMDNGELYILEGCDWTLLDPVETAPASLIVFSEGAAEIDPATQELVVNDTDV